LQLLVLTAYSEEVTEEEKTYTPRGSAILSSYERLDMRGHETSRGVRRNAFRFLKERDNSKDLDVPGC
jgi:hypothetical protein